MKKRKRPKSRIGHLADMFLEDKDALAKELVAMSAFLRMWGKDYKAEGDNRLSLITSIVGDLCDILAFSALRDADVSSGRNS